MNATPAQRPLIRVVIAAVFTVLGLNAWRQVVAVMLAGWTDPPTITILQALIGASGLATAWGAWTGARWAPVLATTYGILTAALLVVLDPILGLGAAARRGLWIAATLVLLFSIACAWYLRRTTSHAPSDVMRDRV